MVIALLILIAVGVLLISPAGRILLGILVTVGVMGLIGFGLVIVAVIVMEDYWDNLVGILGVTTGAIGIGIVGYFFDTRVKAPHRETVKNIFIAVLVMVIVIAVALMVNAVSNAV